MTANGLLLALAVQSKVSGGGTKGLPPAVFFILAVIACFVLLTLLGVLVSFARLWLRAQVAGAPVSILNLIVMRLRRLPVERIVAAHILACEAGLKIAIHHWSDHCMARGNLELTLESLLKAHKGGLKLPPPDPLPEDHTPELNLFFWLSAHCLLGGDPVAVVDTVLAEGSSRDMEAYREACVADLSGLQKERNDAAQSGGARPVNA